MTMMRKSNTLLLSAALLGFLAGGPISVLADEKTQSTALQIALATGLTDARKGPLFDTPRSELPEELRNVPNHYKFEDALDVGLYSSIGLLEMGGSATAWARGGRISPDMANLAFAGLGLLLYSPTRPHPATESKVIAWMPAGPKGSRREERDARAEARAEMTEIFIMAAAAALPDGIVAGQRNDRSNLSLTGLPECDAAPARCLLYVVTYQPNRALDLDGNDSWHWRNHQPGDKQNQLSGTLGTPSIWVQPHGTRKDQWRLRLTLEHEYLHRLSQALPSWAWVYVPPSDAGPAVMLNQGHAHYFIEPLN
jgi:hypothetical protein